MTCPYGISVLLVHLCDFSQQKERGSGGNVLAPSKETWYGPASLSATTHTQNLKMPKRQRTSKFTSVPASSLRPGQRQALRRQQTRRAKGRNALVRVPRNKLGFPQSMRTKLRFCERVEFTPTSTSIQQIKFRANGMYDPNVQVGAGQHQPRGFDEFMAIYKTFTVHGSTCSVSFMYEGYSGPSLTSALSNLTQSVQTTTDNIVPALSPILCGLYKGIEELAAGTGQEQIEKDRMTWTYINGQQGHKTLRTSCKISDFYGKPALTGAEGYTGSDSADPTEQVLYEVWAARVSDDYPAETTKVVGYVTIEYDATFTEPKALAQS